MAGRKPGTYASRWVYRMLLMYEALRPYILSLVKQEVQRKMADRPEGHASPAKKRKRSQERSSSELGSVPGLPHTPIKPRPSGKMSRSPSKPKPVKYLSDGGAGPSRIPTSDVDEDDLESTLGLNPKCTQYFVYFELNKKLMEVFS
jgi:E3 ubiquitin-protein ligase RAD18